MSKHIGGNETLLKIIKEYTEPGTTIIGGWVGVVSIVTTYMLDSPEFENWWGKTNPKDHPASYTAGTSSLSGLRRPGHGTDHSPQTSARL